MLDKIPSGTLFRRDQGVYQIEVEMASWIKMSSVEEYLTIHQSLLNILSD